MAHQDALIDTDIAAYLAAQENKSLLRFITCGSVDDGKSTLIGRLLYESKLLYDDQLASLQSESKAHGTQGDDIDFALLVDGLAAEREQGITIDVAYRYFSTEKRKFIVADTPGHEQYTRNMATAASTADLAILLIDARQGVVTQTRRHAYIVSLLGIRHIVLAVNKMDLVDYSAARFQEICDDFAGFADRLDFASVTAIPVSALKGDNIVAESAMTGWYDGPALMPFLETVAAEKPANAAGFTLPVQWVNRPDMAFRGFSGQVASGQMSAGDKVRILPGGRESKLDRIVTANGDLPIAQTGQSVTLTLADEIDVSRGAVICAADEPVEAADQFEAHILWMAEDAMLPGRPYLMKMGTQTGSAIVNTPKYKVNVNTLEELATRTLELNEIGLVTLSVDRQMAFTPYQDNRLLGSFILIDKATNHTVGAGMIRFALRRAANVHWQALDIDRQKLAEQKGQKPAVLWFTGLSGSGKSTIANALQQKMFAAGRHTTLLDGDNVRHGLNRDLGFTDADRVENIRRVGEVAKLMLHAGLFPLVSFISPFRAERQLARDLVEDGEFIEIHVATPLSVAEARDPKGLYKKARAGEIANFTGIDSPYEPPESPEISIDTTELSAEQAADKIIAYLLDKGLLAG